MMASMGISLLLCDVENTLSFSPFHRTVAGSLSSREIKMQARRLTAIRSCVARLLSRYGRP